MGVAALISELPLRFLFSSSFSSSLVLAAKKCSGLVLLDLRSPTVFLHFVLLALFPLVSPGSVSAGLNPSLLLDFVEIVD